MNIELFEKTFGTYIKEGTFYKGSGQIVSPHSHDANSGQINPGIGVGSQNLFIEGSILFAGIGGSISEDNDNLFWDDINKRFGLGTNTPDTLFHIEGNPSTALIKITRTGTATSKGLEFLFNAQILSVFNFISDGPADTDKHAQLTISSGTDGAIFNFIADIDNPTSSNFMNPKFGIGLTNSNNPFTLDTSIATNQASKEPSMIMQGIANKERFSIRSKSASVFQGHRFNGSIVSPTAILSGNLLASFAGGGHDGVSFQTSLNAGMNCWAGSNWSGSNHETYITLVVTQNGATNAVEAARITSTKRIAIDVTVPLGKLHVDQPLTSDPIPVLYLDQADISEEMIEFNTTIGVGNAIEAVGAKTLTTTHFIKVTIPGGLTRYIPCGTIA